MRAPAFWWRPTPSCLALLLRPASLLYGAVSGSRMARTGKRAPVPVICVGNFTAGGAGKTPTALALARMLAAMGERPAFLSRGYGGTLTGPVRVMLAAVDEHLAFPSRDYGGTLAGPVRVAPGHGAAEVGDEPLLLARAAPTIVSRDRPAGAQLAAEGGASVIIMDDGLQNPSLTKDLALAVVDGATGFGNGLPLPSGPLRAPIEAQWAKADAVLIVGDGAAGDAIARSAESRGKPMLRGWLEAEPQVAAQLAGRRVLAFAGIGRPQKFFDTLRACGAVVEVERVFPDHHAFGPAELAALKDEAARRGLLLVTTEKDMARLGQTEFVDNIIALPIRLQVEDEEKLRSLVIDALARMRQSPA